MCLGAAQQARVATVVYGAKSAKFGAAGSLTGTHHPEMVGGVLAAESAELLQDFFRRRRK